jgi:hypothetical protein
MIGVIRKKIQFEQNSIVGVWWIRFFFDLSWILGDFRSEDAIQTKNIEKKT